MVDLQTVIDEINTEKIKFDYKDDDCCTTEGEVVILLKRLAELEKADVEEVKSEAVKEFAERLKSGIGVMVTHIRNGHAKHILELIDNLVKEMDGGNKNGL